MSNEQIEDEYDNDESRNNWNIDEVKLKEMKIEELMFSIIDPAIQHCKDKIIPSDYYLLNPNSYEWLPMIGKKGKNKDVQLGWTTNEINGSKMDITFSMSSQLWIQLGITEELQQFIIASEEVNTQPKYNYIDLLDKLT